MYISVDGIGMNRRKLLSAIGSIPSIPVIANIAFGSNSPDFGFDPYDIYVVDSLESGKQLAAILANH